MWRWHQRESRKCVRSERLNDDDDDDDDDILSQQNLIRLQKEGNIQAQR